MGKIVEYVIFVLVLLFLAVAPTLGQQYDPKADKKKMEYCCEGDSETESIEGKIYDKLARDFAHLRYLDLCRYSKENLEAAFSKIFKDSGRVDEGWIKQIRCRVAEFAPDAIVRETPCGEINLEAGSKVHITIKRAGKQRSYVLFSTGKYMYEKNR